MFIYHKMQNLVWDDIHEECNVRVGDLYSKTKRIESFSNFDGYKINIIKYDSGDDSPVPKFDSSVHIQHASRVLSFELPRCTLDQLKYSAELILSVIMNKETNPCIEDFDSRKEALILLGATRFSLTASE